MTVITTDARPRNAALPLFVADPYSLEHAHSGELVTRRITRRSRKAAISEIPSLVDADDPATGYDGSWLRASQRPASPAIHGDLRIADLFSGIGGLSVGAFEASRSVGLRPEFVYAADTDERVLHGYERNFAPRWASSEPIEAHLDGELGAPLTATECELRATVGSIDLVLAGPPCQGHSDLNNHTRRADARNELYLRAIRFVEVFQPDHVLVENVPGVLHDRRGVVQLASAHLKALGYSIDGGVVRAELVGVPQKRRRFFLLGSRSVRPSVEGAVRVSHTAPRSVSWAIADLKDAHGEEPFETSARHSQRNEERIAYLFDQALYELPDSERPSCHRDKAHTYRSVYGRMRPDEPAPTITVGFGSTGQGRFVHPHRPRTLTPHEAARVQTFPDWFDFSQLGRRMLQKSIGNAVPPLLANAVLRELLA